MTMNNAQRFATLDADSRSDSIERSRKHIELEQSKLAGKLVAHAAALIEGVFPIAEAIVFYLTAVPGDAASVQITQVLDNAGGELEVAPDFRLAPAGIREAEEVLAEASDLGADFRLADAGDRQRQVDVGDPLNGVRLPVEV